MPEFIREDAERFDEITAGLDDGTLVFWRKDSAGTQWYRTVGEVAEAKEICGVSPAYLTGGDESAILDAAADLELEGDDAGEQLDAGALADLLDEAPGAWGDSGLNADAPSEPPAPQPKSEWQKWVEENLTTDMTDFGGDKESSEAESD